MIELVRPNIEELFKRMSDFAHQVPDDLKPFFDERLWQARALRELGRDLRDLSLRRDRAHSHEPLFESVRPLGLVGHIMPGNSQWTSLLAILESVIVGNTAWAKLPSDQDPSELKEQLALLGLSKSVLVINSRDEAKEYYSKSDAISAWGSESSLEEIRKEISPQIRFIPWGHRISFAYLSIFENQAYDLAQAMVKYEQQACSSPQLIYLENATFEQACKLGAELAHELEKYQDSFPELDDGMWAELSNFTRTHQSEACLREKKVLVGKKQEYRIVIDADPCFEPSVLNRTIFIKTIQSSQISNALRPFRKLLQTAGLVCHPHDIALKAEMLLEAGVSRVCPVTAMQDAHPLESHDGEYSLNRFVKRVVVHHESRLNVLTQEPIEIDNRGPITHKNDFAQSAAPVSDYLFKSGGSTSKAILSPFELEDYHLQMQVAADGLIAAGLEPASDRCMNVFYGGGLYGGFLSFTDILEKCRVTQYPMAGYLELDFVLTTLIDEKINVLLGMPSYIISLFKAAEEKSLKLPVDKIFFGGEPFSKEQREWLKTKGVELIRSASYGSVDAGPLGYQCVYSDAGVHHINSIIQQIEIVAMDEDRPCRVDEVGRVLVTSKARRSVAINRYQIGDTARWIQGRCECGDQNPRLELMGRVGDVFKLGGSFINARKLMALSNGTSFQVQLEIKDLKDCLRIICDDDVTEMRSKILAIPDLNEVIVQENSVILLIESKGYIHASSGKIPLVVDQRR